MNENQHMNIIIDEKEKIRNEILKICLFRCYPWDINLYSFNS